MNKIILYIVLLFVVIFSHGCACRKVLVDTPKIQIIEPERCVSASTKLPFKPFKYQIENGKLVFDNKNLIILNQNIAILKTAYEELKLCYTNQIDYYV
jgi:hypothetical protein